MRLSAESVNSADSKFQTQGCTLHERSKGSQSQSHTGEATVLNSVPFPLLLRGESSINVLSINLHT